MPTNFIHIGFIHALFPNAPIIHLNRNPMAVGWSLFRRRFAEGQTYSSDLEDIAEFIWIHHHYTKYWRKSLPARILDIQYERLITEPESELVEILQHMDLPWDDRCLSFANADRRVATASATTVRGALDSTKIDDWQRYAKHLQPLRDALARRGLLDASS